MSVKLISSAILVGGLAVISGCTSISSTNGYAALEGLPKIVSRSPEYDASHRTRDRIMATRTPTETVDYAQAYAAKLDGDVSVSAFDYQNMNRKFLRQQVRYFGSEPAGTIVVDANAKFLYFVQPNGLAMRYGIAVGKEGYGWTGNSNMQWKQKWPTWTPPAEMIERHPEYAKYAEGLEGSPSNPLGARAMYLFKGGKDTLYRIHGTNKPHSICKAASSGCFRMINQDVIDLYDRVSGKPGVYVRDHVTQVAEFQNGR